MRAKTKAWLIVAFSLILVGCMILGGAMAMLKWDFSKLSTVKYETNEHTVSEDYQNISVVTDTADIVFVPSESETCSVVCYERKNATHSVAVKDGTLVIELNDTRKWHEHIGIAFGAPKITVYLPQSEYGTLSVTASTGDVKLPEDFQFESIDVSVTTGDVTCLASASGKIALHATTGDIRVENVSAGALDLSVSTGDIAICSAACEGDLQIHVTTGNAQLTDVTCGSLTSTGSTGDISLKHVIAAGQLSVTRSTGDVKLNGSDAAEIFIKTGTGSVTGSLLSDKIFVAGSDTGRVDVPHTATGGQCVIQTNTGNIKIVIQSNI